MPDELKFKKIEFNTYIEKCYCEDEINNSLKKEKFIEEIRGLNVLKNWKIENNLIII